MARLDGIRCVLFDAVGTLMYADPPVASVYHAVAQRHGSALPQEEIEVRFRAALADATAPGEPTSESQEHLRWRRIVAQVVRDVPQAHDSVFAQLWQHFAEPTSWRLFDDVEAVWAELSRRGLKLGIASNFDGRLRQVVAGHPCLANCQNLFVSSEIGYSKPDVRFFRIVEQQLCLSSAEIALVGDDQVADYQGAAQAGWQSILLDRNTTPTAYVTIQSLIHLLP